MVPTGRLKPLLSVVVPCRDEVENLPRFPRELFAPLDALGVPWEAVIVDDGSRDGTSAEAHALAASRAGVTVATLVNGRGLGGALRAGFSAATGEWLAAVDADLTFRPEDLGAMLAVARETGADMVSGSPYLRRGDLDAVPWSRRLPSLMLNAFYRGVFGTTLTSYTPMFRVYRAARLRELPLVSDGFEISAEIAARARQSGWKTAEVPVPLGVRSAGASKLARGRELARHARLILRLLGGR